MAVPGEKPMTVDTAGEKLDAPVEAAVLVLADEAQHGRLSICAGAGLSLTAGLPSGTALAELLHARFQRVAGYACVSPRNLLAVADAAAKLPDGLEAVQRAAVDLAPFDSARPQLEHRLLSLLVAEGALTLLLTNWDNCVERSRQKVELVPAARNDREAESLRGQFILKIHGCCTQRDTLLITSAQLGDAPLWTRAFFQARLAESTMVFVGIGDVADYARQRIAELAESVDNARIRVVSPDIADGWEESTWRGILPDLPAGRRIAATADKFLDELAREWAMQLVMALRAGEASPSIEAVTRAFVNFTASQALEWLRQAMVGPKAGESVVRDPAAESLLEAIGLLARTDDRCEGDEAPVRFLGDAAVIVNGERVEAMICRSRQTAAGIETAVTERARDYVSRRGPTPVIEVLIAASSVRGPRPTVLEAVSVVDPDSPVDDLLASAEQVRVHVTYADDLLATA